MAHRKKVQDGSSVMLPEGWRSLQRGGGPFDISNVLEAICLHGVGHPIVLREDGDGVHGCDGCCSQLDIIDLRVDR